ncbi:TPA: recombinase family protein [Aeromonas salmonicida]|nr:recombinase family protein [Aeromonas salmonicida]ELI6442215.1 recombinase family protein [Aeromonas salmonicida subsp. salmonicida]ASI21482.1 resolvase [Aeromonas salmonicida]ASI25848.1 resolvase [Aeromonas salmonicida]ASI29949.1 resolvase [Aeromonas salmonicida]ELM3711645.1 recombinase family protein [Aeromonas salmonicida subsp. salmonicida]
MSNRIFAYLRASTKEQDAQRGRAPLMRFAAERGILIDGWFEENESGATFNRPELFRLLELARPGDILLAEQVDRISRLASDDWERLKGLIKGKGIRVVALDLPTSWAMLIPGDSFQERMLSAINDMMLDMLAAIARKDYEDRRRRQAEGIAKAKREGRYKGRPVDSSLHDRIRLALSSQWSWSQIEDNFKCSRATIAKVAREMRAPPRITFREQLDIIETGALIAPFF